MEAPLNRRGRVEEVLRNISTVMGTEGNWEYGGTSDGAACRIWAIRCRRVTPRNGCSERIITLSTDGKAVGDGAKAGLDNEFLWAKPKDGRVSWNFRKASRRR